MPAIDGLASGQHGVTKPPGTEIRPPSTAEQQAFEEYEHEVTLLGTCHAFEPCSVLFLQVISDYVDLFGVDEKVAVFLSPDDEGKLGAASELGPFVATFGKQVRRSEDIVGAHAAWDIAPSLAPRPARTSSPTCAPIPNS